MVSRWQLVLQWVRFEKRLELMMSSRDRIDPELMPLVEMSAEWSAATLPAQREALDAMGQAVGAIPLPDMTRAELRAIDGPDGAPPVQLLIMTPTASAGKMPAILHIHGGGFVAGSAQLYRPQLASLSAQLDAVIVSVNYRLAPETIFPGAIEDCFAALKWLFAQAEELGVDRERIVVAGESAGGGLAAALAILARDRGVGPLVAQMLAFPMLDDRTGSTRDAGDFVGEFVWTAADNKFGWSSLLGRSPGDNEVSPYAAPARCEDLSGLPPAFIAVGDLDLFLEENLEYARRLARAGVPIELKVYPGAVHGFMLVETSRAARLYAADQRAAYLRAFG
ncbi:MAG: alpha/beta hydrolase [Sphingomonas sp.]|uniref:alpha/beta hydrolase n=1 Tax=Sphingomonas sp. TaxID=28214 RepID=UPI003568F545